MHFPHFINTNDCYEEACKQYTTRNQQGGRDQAIDNESKRLEKSVRTCTIGIPNAVWAQVCMTETVISLVWVSKKTKTLREMQDCPTTNTLQYILKHK